MLINHFERTPSNVEIRVALVGQIRCLPSLDLLSGLVAVLGHIDTAEAYFSQPARIAAEWVRGPSKGLDIHRSFAEDLAPTTLTQ